jgi:hypothetical protein
MEVFACIDQSENIEAANAQRRQADNVRRRERSSGCRVMKACRSPSAYPAQGRPRFAPRAGAVSLCNVEPESPAVIQLIVAAETMEPWHGTLAATTEEAKQTALFGLLCIDVEDVKRIAEFVRHLHAPSPFRLESAI